MAQLLRANYNSFAGLDFRSVFANTAFMALTPKQKNVLDFVASFTERSGYCPQLRRDRTGRRTGVPSLPFTNTLRALQQKGYLKRRYNESRSLEVFGRLFAFGNRVVWRNARTYSAFEIPLMGTIAAGAPVEAMESP